MHKLKPLSHLVPSPPLGYTPRFSPLPLHFASASLSASVNTCQTVSSFETKLLAGLWVKTKPLVEELQKYFSPRDDSTVATQSIKPGPALAKLQHGAMKWRDTCHHPGISNKVACPCQATQKGGRPKEQSVASRTTAKESPEGISLSPCDRP